MDLKSIVLPPPRPGSAAELTHPHLSPLPARRYSANALPSIATVPGDWKGTLPPSPVHSPSTKAASGNADVPAMVEPAMKQELESHPPTNDAVEEPTQSSMNSIEKLSQKQTNNHVAPEVSAVPILNRKPSSGNFKVSKSPPKSLRKAKSMASLGSTLSHYPPPPLPDFYDDDEPTSPTSIKTEQVEPATPSIPIISTLPSSTSVSSRRHAHILSEQRRRENINGGFQQLRNAVPYCRGTQLSKAVILKKAVEYIAALEEEVYNLRYRPQMQAHGPPQPPHPHHQPSSMHHLHPHHPAPVPLHLHHPSGTSVPAHGPPPHLHMPVYSSSSPFSYHSSSHSMSHMPTQPPIRVPERPASAEGTYDRRSSHDYRGLRSSSTTSLVDNKLPSLK